MIKLILYHVAHICLFYSENARANLHLQDVNRHDLNAMGPILKLVKPLNF